MNDQQEQLAALLHEGRCTVCLKRADWLIAHGVTVGPGSPVRDPAPPTCDHCKGPMELIWACYHKHPVVYRLARSAGIELGVRDPSPPEPERLWALVTQWREAAEYCRTPPKREEIALLWDRVADELKAVIGVRGAGVVPQDILIANLQSALVEAGHDADCPVVHGASADCVPGTCRGVVPSAPSPEPGK